MSTETQESLARMAQQLVSRRRGVVLTGAGISVDSGIPDFRSAGGLWERVDPMEYATIDAFEADPLRVWKMLAELSSLLHDALPNPGHHGVARLEQRGVVDGVVTQNIDNLHQKAGSLRVVEFHGNGARLRCTDCDQLEPEVRSAACAMPPRCSACGKVLKPDVVFFGEPIPDAAMNGALELLDGCQVVLVVGTSLTVAPASMLPLAARQQGAQLFEINLEPTELSATCDISVHGSATRLLPQLADAVDSLMG